VDDGCGVGPEAGEIVGMPMDFTIVPRMASITGFPLRRGLIGPRCSRKVQCYTSLATRCYTSLATRARQIVRPPGRPSCREP